MTKIPRSVLTWDSVAAPIPTFELVPGTLFSKLRTHKTRRSGAMSIRQCWSLFLENNRRLFWHQRDSEFLSWFSSILLNMSMNSDMIFFCEWARQTLKKTKLQSAPPTDY
jgi:hypothetical protein